MTVVVNTLRIFGSYTCFTVWSLRSPPPLGMSSPFHGGAQNFSGTPQIHQEVFGACTMSLPLFLQW